MSITPGPENKGKTGNGIDSTGGGSSMSHSGSGMGSSSTGTGSGSSTQHQSGGSGSQSSMGGSSTGSHSSGSTGSSSSSWGSQSSGSTGMSSSENQNMAGQHTEGIVARTIEQQTAKLPSDTFLWLALGSIATSATLHVMGYKDQSRFVGQWVSPFLLFGVYNKIVKTQGSDQYSS